MRFSMIAILAFVPFLTILSTTDAIVAKPENSLNGPYIAGAEYLAWWDLTGSAQFADSVVRLTTDEQEKQGAIWNNFPNILNDWEFHIQFQIHGKGVHLNGDGMAIWYVREPLIAGPVFGYRDHFNGLGLFIDTFEDQAHPHNHNHPYISLVINNGSQHYEHDAEGTVTQIGGCHVPVRNLEWPARIAISYISQVISVFTDAGGTNSWSACFTSHGVQLPTGYYFGVSASTGIVSDNHDVVSITTLDMTMADKLYEDRTHVVPYAPFVQIPARPRPLEVVPEEHLQKVEVKREVHHEEIVAEVQPAPEVHHIPETHHIPEMHPVPELHPMPEVHHIPEVKDREPLEHKHEPLEHKHEPLERMFEPQEHKHSEEPKVAEPKVEHRTSEAESESAAKPASFLRKAIYIAGIGLLLYVAISMFRQYNARRKERIQKRLY